MKWTFYRLKIVEYGYVLAHYLHTYAYIYIGIVKAMVFPVARYGYERWTIKKAVPKN